MDKNLNQKLKEALQDYFRAIELQKVPEISQRPPLRPHFEKLDRLRDELPPDADPRLRHFMTQKSYEKALLFLEDTESH